MNATVISIMNLHHYRYSLYKSFITFKLSVTSIFVNVFYIKLVIFTPYIKSNPNIYTIELMTNKTFFSQPAWSHMRPRRA